MRPVALLTDFGLSDHYVGVVHAVLEKHAPGVPRIDLDHLVPPGDIIEASFQLRCAWPHLPAGCIVMAVVDPGVGTSRRALALALGRRFLVAPDNGLAAALGPAADVVEIDWRAMGLPKPSRTFHGRDVFAPAAAWLARGEELEQLGDEVEFDTLVSCPLPDPEPLTSGYQATVISVDRFGNLATNLPASSVTPNARAAWSSDGSARRVQTYSEAEDGEVVLLEGSAGFLELAVYSGSAAMATGLRRGDSIRISGLDDGDDE
ncbi:MAG: SAM-dependent chlorinase/fluorinase [Candidatus Sulfomarinibacteraceae bacterium]